jgi:HD superfamily phosphohydrolase
LAKLKRIRDVIYGFILPDEQECDIINHPVFQRLRRIRQLSLTDMVYPGATHTRFEHSIGVMQMASDMFDCVVINSKQLLTRIKG